MKTRNWKKTGYLLPTVIDPDENICICVPVPKDWGHINAFLGQITDLAKWLTWEKTGDDSALQAARRWIEISECVMQEVNKTMASGCGCGGSSEPTNQRYTEDGHLEVSNDDGITWQNADGIDPRFNSPVFPPMGGADGDDKRCKAANSVVAWLEEAQSQASAVLGAAGGITGLIAAAAAAFAGAGVTLVPAIIIALLGAALNVIASLGQSVFDGSFGGTFWDDVLCIVYCEMEADASFTEQGWQNVKAKILALPSSYPANEWTSYMVNTAGLVGLINAARGGMIGTRSCDSCDCTDPCDNSYTTGRYLDDPVDFGTIIDFGDGYFTLQLNAGGYGVVHFEDVGSCCYINSYVEETGDTFPVAFIPCGSTYEDEGSWTIATFVDQCPQVLQVQGDGGATITILFDRCP